MQAVVSRCYGSADVLELESVEKPTPADNQALAKVRAASVNPLDWHYMRGSPCIVRLGPKGNWIAPLMGPIKALVLSPFVDQELSLILAELTQEDLIVLSDLMQAGKMTSVIDRRYSLSEVPDAIRYSESGRARGKILINME